MSGSPTAKPTRVSLLALPESSAAALYGLHEVLSAVGDVWASLTGEAAQDRPFAVRFVAARTGLLRCHGGMPLEPDADFAESGPSDVVVVSDLAIPIDADPRGRWPEALAWLREQYEGGATLCTVCSGAVLLAETGLLDGRAATSHWGFVELFRRYLPAVELQPERILVASGPEQRLVTAGGMASWEDLALYLIARFSGEAAALRIAKAYVLGDRSEGQLPYAAMTRSRRHDDAAVADGQVWLAEHYARANPVREMVARSGLAERSFTRRFRAATGYTPIAYLQALRVEEAKQMLETGDLSAEETGRAVGYEDPAFFRRLFKRLTGVTPGRYRQRVRKALPRATGESHNAVGASGGRRLA